MPAQNGRLLAGSFALGDAAVAAWLWYAFLRFTGKPAAFWPGMLGPIIVVPLLAFAFGLSKLRPRGQIQLIARTLVFGASVAALGTFAGARGWLPVSSGEALWLGAAGASLVWLQRAVYFGSSGHSAVQPWEVLRWIAVGIAGCLVMLPFYHNGGLGAGDAHWYAVMLADFLAQLRGGVFPVWVGQSVDAFNGAVSPLRYAPGFQYFGGIVDLLTARALEPMAVRNASLAVASLLGAFSAYVCLRAISGRRPWVACGLSVLWMSGPGVWAPAVVGDQYMTFTAIPFLPLVLYGCWRVWEFDDGWSRFWIAVGLAGTWLCHSPIALWMTVIAAGIYLPALLMRRSWRRETGMTAFMAATFLVLGAVPFISVLALDDKIQLVASADYTVEMVRTYFPGNFLPIGPGNTGLGEYQLGYSLLGALVVSLLLLARLRPRVAWGFAVAAVVIVPFFVPIPWLTKALWTHVPVWFVTVENVWPMQRMFLVWSTLVVFLAAIMLGSPKVGASGWKRVALVAAFFCGAMWSAREAYEVFGDLGRSTAAESRISYSPDNILLTRYAYSPFEYAPAYFSHAYMEPWFENRLLDWHTLEPVVTNADAAAPMPSAGAPQDSRLVQSGVITAEEIIDSTYYHLLPALVLEPGKHYAMRLDFTDPDLSGTLQIVHPSMFREYGMPDSGAGIKRAGPDVASLAFGSGATNSHVIPMILSGAAPYSISPLFIADKRGAKSFPFAKYWLYTYDRSQLPIDVESWIPYRAQFEAKGPAYLETPRMWLKGWRATVNGRAAATVRSPENLVMVPVASGENRVVLEYHAPDLLSAAFWLSTVGWTGLGALGLLQLALFSGGTALNRRSAERVPTPARMSFMAPGGFHSNAARSWTIAAAFAVLAAMAAVFFPAGRRRASQAFNLGGAGPIRIEFTRPYRQLGLTQPFLSTGHPHAGTIVFIKFLDRRHVQLGADVWGSLFKSEPIDMDYNETESLVVSDGALFPLDDPKVNELSPREQGPLRGELRLELNGKIVLQAACNAYETLPSEILVGESRFGSVSDNKFLGEILKAERLPVPRTMTLPHGWHAQVRARFPKNRIGSSEPILTETLGPDVLLWYVTYLDSHRLRITSQAEGGGPIGTAEVTFEPERDHEFEFRSNGATIGANESCEFDGVPVVTEAHSSSGLPPVLASGFTPANVAGVSVRFTGPYLDLALHPDSPSTTGPGAMRGAEHMIVRLPAQKTGRGEPLLVTGKTGAGDFIYVTYEDEKHIRLGYDHWGVGGMKTDPIEIDYSVPHEIWVSLGTLYPPGDVASWAGESSG